MRVLTLGYQSAAEKEKPSLVESREPVVNDSFREEMGMVGDLLDIGQRGFELLTGIDR